MTGNATVDLTEETVEEQGPEMSPNDRKFMDKLVELMEKNMDNGELVVDDLVQELAVSRSVFFKKLKTLILVRHLLTYSCTARTKSM